MSRAILWSCLIGTVALNLLFCGGCILGKAANGWLSRLEYRAVTADLAAACRDVDKWSDRFEAAYDAGDGAETGRLLLERDQALRQCQALGGRLILIDNTADPRWVLYGLPGHAGGPPVPRERLLERPVLVDGVGRSYVPE